MKANIKKSPDKFNTYFSNIMLSDFSFTYIIYYKLQKSETKNGTLISIKIPWTIAMGIISFPE